jgi:hypothetical protein
MKGQVPIVPGKTEERAPMGGRLLVPLIVLFLGLLPVRAQEFRAGIGVYILAKDGLDLQVGYRPKQSHWQFGYRYVQWTDKFEDPFTDRRLTETTQSMTGPLVAYLFRPESRGTWYVGASVLQWSKRERSLITGEVDRASTTAPFVGGGYTRAPGKHFYFNLGLYLSPGTKLSTRTSVSSEEDSGAFDIQIQMGVAF